jgi:hypothetical protein
MSKKPETALSPLLVRQWHPTKNGDSLPSDFTAGSSKKMWWMDEFGHEWEAKISNRTNGSGCLACAGKQVLTNYNDLFSQRPVLATFWDYTLNNVTPDQVLAQSSKIFNWKCPAEGHTWSAAPARIHTETCPVCELRICIAGVNDLPTTHPILVGEWHPTKNEGKSPMQFTARSSANVWWLGPCGHEWENPISRRALKGKGCPICINSQVLESFNDLATTSPLIAAQWHPTKNGSFLPTQFTKGSNHVAWWLDEHSHEWDAPITERQKYGCPVCAGFIILVGFNDLASQSPIVASQWDYKKNGDITPQMVTAYTHAKHWWLCDKNHSWDATVGSRVRGAGCPYCSGAKILLDFNDLEHTHPILAREWHPTENNLTPREVGAGSGYKAKWTCEKHGVWKAAVKDRVYKGSGCPSCSRSISQPENDIKAFLQALGLAVEDRVTGILSKREEIDLYIPEQKFGIEFNGIRWHSDMFKKNKDGHLSKYLAAKAAGIQLVQIWEDDWKKRQPTILRALAHKLGVTERLVELYPELQVETNRVFARKTQVTELTSAEAKQFLEFNHIQGFASGSYYLGLQDDQQFTRAVLVLKKEAGTNGQTLNIVRYATSGTVVGGFTKLLKQAIKTYQPKDFITFADHCISNGGLYENNGFVADKELPPDYMYVVKGERKHKFGYRLKRFRDDPELLWDESMSERELAQLNNIPRIWDAGKTRYRYTV